MLQFLEIWKKYGKLITPLLEIWHDIEKADKPGTQTIPVHTKFDYKKKKVELVGTITLTDKTDTHVTSPG